MYQSKSTNYNWYNRHFYVPQFFQLPSLVEVFIFLFTFFQFYFGVSRDSKVHNLASSLFIVVVVVVVTKSGRLAEIR